MNYNNPQIKKHISNESGVSVSIIPESVQNDNETKKKFQEYIENLF